ncbi:MAG TPA: D-cysteine desulfhydrase family protein [Acidimicrobiia bacterium]|jgi:D-cysteine desulfhydrase|nr:D-cysteine desulfhydrase family protein [Acidimicrobiia bacterium]
MPDLPSRLRLALLPTALQRCDALSNLWGGPTIWIKRDDLTGFGASGNKVRKLEFHMAAAQEAGADTVITCGAAQSNHCRATALSAAALGLRSILLLRTSDGQPPGAVTGNYLLDRLAGADIRFVTPAEYDERTAAMADVAAEVAAGGGSAWVIPEGASDPLGMWGFVLALRELEQQLGGIDARISAVWHASSSGATTAGLGWGADRLGLDLPIVGASVGDSVTDLRLRVDAIWEEAIAAHGGTLPRPDLELTDDHVGLGYGLTTDDELAAQVEVTAHTGLILDPTYTGKALTGLRSEILAGRYAPSEHVVFWHTGGGFAVFAHDFGATLSSRRRTGSPADPA